MSDTIVDFGAGDLTGAPDAPISDVGEHSTPDSDTPSREIARGLKPVRRFWDKNRGWIIPVGTIVIIGGIVALFMKKRK